jgi:hypothetical protein
LRAVDSAVTYCNEPMPDQPWRRDTWAVYVASDTERRRCVGRFHEETEARDEVIALRLSLESELPN